MSVTATEKATAATFDEVRLHPDGTVEFWDCFNASSKQ